MVRIVEIIINNQQFTFMYKSSEMRDSEALHRLLCEVDPGDDYSARFYNATDN